MHPIFLILIIVAFSFLCAICAYNYQNKQIEKENVVRKAKMETAIKYANDLGLDFKFCEEDPMVIRLETENSILKMTYKPSKGLYMLGVTHKVYDRFFKMESEDFDIIIAIVNTLIKK